MIFQVCRRLALIVAAVISCGVFVSGCKVEKPEPPRSSAPHRVVSLIPSATELLVAIGQEDKLVGVTLNDTFPESVQTLPKVGDMTIDFEKLVSLKPDLVLVDAHFNRDGDKLRSLGLPVYELKCSRLADIAPAMRDLGNRLGQPEKASLAADQFEEGLRSFVPLKEHHTAFVEIWSDPLMTSGDQTLIQDLLTGVGLKNTYSDQMETFQVNLEDLASRQPEIVILPVHGDSDRGVSKVVELSGKVAGWEPDLVTIDSDLLVRAGPRVLEGMRRLRNSVQSIENSKKLPSGH